jgi:predicted aconitase with swiveling domain
MEEIDPALATGALLAQIMLERSIPVVDRLGVSPTDLFRTGDIVEVDADRGEVRKVQ